MTEPTNFDTPPEATSPKMVPNSREAEEAVIGAVLINPEAYYDVAQFLNSDDFYIHRHKWIWETFAKLHDSKIAIDFITVTEELDRMGHLSDIGGAAYIAQLTSNVPSSLHAEAYGHRIEETAIRRRMIEAANEIAQLAYKENLSLETVMDGSEKAVFNVSEKRLSRDLEPIQHVLSKYYNRIEDIANRDSDLVGVPTGFKDLDKLLGGLQASDLLIIAGRPGMGKTGFLLTAARNAAVKHKQHIAIFSMEMSNEQVVQRIISQETGISTQKLRRGELTDKQWELLSQSIDVLSDTHIFLDDTPALTPIQLRTKCRRLHLEHRIDLIIVDYLQLMTTDLRNNNRVQEVSEISRNLKILARELDVPVLAAAQLSRAVEQRSDKRPVLSDLRESGSLEQDADIVMFIYRPEQYEEETIQENLAEIIISKHRNGPTGNIQLFFRKELVKFENAATDTRNINEMAK
ncbi:MAG: replicative DNA helicase [Chloroflexota bacterium]|nr:MAG: replicative DNA helicase [Anaerolineaceae bacterium 4572_5.2]RLD11170.1 MAG: replicative DNA helicase [Chloroflexota bacterium]